METGLLQGIESKTITKAELFEKVEQNFGLLNEVLLGISSSKVLMDLSEKYPEKLYPHMQAFIELLNSKHRILTWNSMAIIANLTKVDTERKFDGIFDKYYDFLNDEYMVTVANVIVNSAKIALAKPYLAQKITEKLLKVENISLTPHLTEECRRVIIEKTVESLDTFYEKIEGKEHVVFFVKRQLESPRSSLRKESQRFLRNWTEN
jgi:hypothetical protein